MDGTVADPVLDRSINKLFAREQQRLLELQQRLLKQLHQFEHVYSLKSIDFYRRYERGEMGDDLDFIEWAATVEMLHKSREKRAVLD
jgi:hypothetical protein